MRRHVALYAPRKDGSCLAERCESIAGRTGECPEKHPLPEVPEIALDLWEWFWSLRRAAGTGMNGPDPIRHSEIAAWKSLHGGKLLPAYVRLMELMDAQYLP